MRAPRIHIDAELGPDRELNLPEGAARHLSRALRLQLGDPVVCFNGRGGEYHGEITAIARSEVRVQLRDYLARENESPLDIVLVQGVSRGDRMDYAVQKAVELGVRAIVPVITERSVVQLKGERAERRQGHWQRVSIGACEQCGRNRVQQITEPVGLAHWLQGWEGGVGLLLSPRGAVSLSGLSAPTGPITLLIGPEGGLSTAEERLALERGFTAVQLGPRILRTETAAVAMLAALQTRWGDFAAVNDG